MPGGPQSRTPEGVLAFSLEYLRASLRQATTSSSSSRAVSTPATSAKVIAALLLSLLFFGLKQHRKSSNKKTKERKKMKKGEEMEERRRGTCTKDKRQKEYNVREYNGVRGDLFNTSASNMIYHERNFIEPCLMEVYLKQKPRDMSGLQASEMGRMNCLACI